ncbi:unnamed protein product [Sphenostylis stenocarpa]|uniref:Uncharacterized protein n=1 Tax=Sphenostylis stenocarpa TaxID=92480 RepID=A0AA86VSK2_9FABA|nr:unnamed protein product [Sphenostylis stenocarpa]
MGNIHSSNNYSERFPLDNSSEVVLRKTKNRRWREVVDIWSAEYYSFGRTNCKLELTKTNSNNQEVLCISIHDHGSGHASDEVDFQINMRVEEGLLVANVTLNGPRCMQQLPERKIPTAQGGVLKSSSFLYGRDTDRKGFIVILREKGCDDDEELPYMITVKHYFVAACSSHGVSVVAKIRSSGDGGLSVEIEKASKHPKGELLKMFDDVKGKGWPPGPASCDGAIEFSNKNNGNVPVMSMSGLQNISSLLSAAGYTNGNYNGSIIFRDCKILFDSAIFGPRNL